KDVVVGARAINHALEHDHQADGDQPAAAYRSNQVRKRMPVDGAESWNRPLAVVRVDDAGLLHPWLRTRINTVLDLDDGRGTRADPARVALRRHLDDGGERQLPVGR